MNAAAKLRMAHNGLVGSHGLNELTDDERADLWRAYRLVLRVSNALEKREAERFRAEEDADRARHFAEQFGFWPGA